MNKIKKYGSLVACTFAVATLLAYAIISTVRSTSDPNPDFGLADRVFAEERSSLKLIEGGDLFEVVYLGMRSYPTPAARIDIISKVDNRVFTRESPIWAENMLIGYEAMHDKLWSNYHGEWEQVCSDCIGTEYANDDTFPYTKSELTFFDYVIPYRESNGLTETAVVAPITCYPGKVRITTFVWENEQVSKDGETARYSTVGEAVPITFEMENPRASSKPFDVISVDFGNNPEWRKPSEEHITLRIRQNDKAVQLPYLDTEAVLYERRVGDRYVEVPPNTYHKIHEYDYRIEEGTRYFMWQGEFGRDDKTADLTYGFYVVPAPSLGEIEPGDYRLTLGFTENEDGSGEQYTLTLNLRFDE